jgi:hypothetical protein
MWSLIKMLVCLGTVGYFLPPELRPALTLEQSQLACKNVATCQEKIKTTLLDEGLNSISVFFKGHEAKPRLKSQNTLAAVDLEIPWQGNLQSKNAKR